MKVIPMNEYQTKVVVDRNTIVLTDNNKKEELKAQKKAKLAETIFCIVIAIIMLVTFVFVLYDALLKPYGYYEADYVNEEGVYIDIDGDGDVYHWVDP